MNKCFIFFLVTPLYCIFLFSLLCIFNYLCESSAIYGKKSTYYIKTAGITQCRRMKIRNVFRNNKKCCFFWISLNVPKTIKLKLLDQIL